MGEEIPSWALQKAVCLLHEANPTVAGCGPVAVFARYIAQHEQPPVDPDVIAVREILAEGCPSTLLDSYYRNGKRDDAPEFQAALAAYRRAKSNA